MYVCVFVMWVKIRKGGKLGEKEKNCECRLWEALVSFHLHVAAQVSVQAWPSHSSHRSHDMLNACACILVWHALSCFNDLAIFFHICFVCILNADHQGST